MRVAEPVPADDDLTALLRRFELSLLQFATRILGDRDRARDVVQETLWNCNAINEGKAITRRPSGFLPSVAIARSTFVERKSA
jgi:hypothetical protein